MENDEQTFRALLKGVSNEKPGIDFASSVMKRVTEEALATEQVHDLVRSSGLTASPSADFAASVMRQLPVKTTWSAEPIISKSAWFSIAASVGITLLVSIILLYGKGDSYASNGAVTILSSTVYNQLTRVPSIYPLTICAAAALVCVDYFVRNSFKKTRPSSPTQIF